MQAGQLAFLSNLFSVWSHYDFTFAYDNVTLEVDPVAIWKLEANW